MLTLHRSTYLVPLTLAVMALASPAAGSESTPCDSEPTNMLIAYSDVLDGADCQINPTADSDILRFVGSVGDVVRIIATKGPTGNGPAICVDLFGPDTMLIDTVCSGVLSSQRSLQLDYTIVQPGEHTILVYELGNDATTTYSLSVTRIFSPDPTSLQHDVVVEDTVDPIADVDIYRFDGVEGEVIRLVGTKGPVGNGPAICAELYGPDESLVDSDCSGTLSSQRSFQIDQTLAETGVYTVVVFELSNDSAPSYSLSLTEIFFSGSPDIFIDSIVNDEIAPTSDLDLFQFLGTANETVQIVATKGPVGNGPAVCVELFGPDETLVQAQCSGTLSSQRSLLIEQLLLTTGVYTVVVFELLHDSEITYSLSPTRVFSPQSPYLRSDQVIGDDLNVADVDLLQFLGTAGDTIRIVATKGPVGNGPAICVDLRGPDQVSLQAKCSGTLSSQRSVQLDDEVLALTGVHTLVVYELQHDSAISYTLSLQCLFGVCAPPIFTDDPVVGDVTQVRAIHFTELRSRINGLRIANGLAPASWANPPTIFPRQTIVPAAHMTELRQALDDVYTELSQPRPVYTDDPIVGGSTSIKAVHVMELRVGVVALE